MFLQILKTQWKWSGLALLVPVFVGFALPMLTVQPFMAGLPSPFASEVLRASANWGSWYPALAGLAGLILAMTAWSADHRQSHIYSLSLPLPRWRLTLLRYLAGLALLALPVASVAIGTHVAVWQAAIPDVLTAYPWSLTLRFGLAATLAYTFFFSIASGTNRTAGYVLALLAGLVVALMLITTAGGSFTNQFLNSLTKPGGPLGIVFNSWMLINV